MALSVYLAGRYRWAAQLDKVARALDELANVSVVSAWHGWVPPSWMSPEQITLEARRMDIAGVEECDVFIFFRKPPYRQVELSKLELLRGGRFIALGMAMALKKKIIVFGSVPMRELSVFETLFDVFSAVYPLVKFVGGLSEKF